MDQNNSLFLNLKKILNDVFGYESFKPLQLDIIQTILNNKHVFVQLITGAGKSICYQIPAIVSQGVTVVVSPLMALMHDQVNSLRLNNIEAYYIDSSQNFTEQKLIYQALLQNKIRLLYISPERFKNREFLSILETIKVDRFVIDEAHCISQWGHDFRKNYLNLTELQDKFPSIPRIALTATADEQTKQDIIELLGLRPLKIYQDYAHRDNLQTFFVPKNNAKKQLLNFLQQRPKEECGLIYCVSRKQVEHIAMFLQEENYKTYIYHAGLDTHIRETNQNLFNLAESGIMIATIAFGLGVNKSNIRYVAHLNLPQSIEHYLQESGRAGRDGLPAVSWVCYGLNDFVLQNERIKNSDQSTEHKQIKLKKLVTMLKFSDTHSCRKCFLATYFNQTLKHQTCDEQAYKIINISTEAMQLLSVLYYTKQNASIAESIQILQGKNKQLIAKYALQQTKIYGIAATHNTKYWRSIIRYMLGLGLLEIANQDQILRFTKDSIRFLKQKYPLSMPVKPVLKGYHFTHWNKTEREKNLLLAITQLRRKKAQELNVIPEQIFDDFTLKEIIQNKPLCLDELLSISGLTQYKINNIGRDIITICTQIMSQQNPTNQLSLLPLDTE